MTILGTGTEIVECIRISKMLETHGEQFLERVYTQNEIEYCLHTANATQHFAKRWAAKEAAMKAMRCRNQGVRWTDIEIVVNAGEGPCDYLERRRCDLGGSGRNRTTACLVGRLSNPCNSLRPGDRRDRLTRLTPSDSQATTI